MYEQGDSNEGAQFEGDLGEISRFIGLREKWESP